MKIIIVDSLILSGMTLACVITMLCVVLVLYKEFYHFVPSGFVLIINDLSSEPKISFTGALVIPAIHKKQVMDIRAKKITIERKGRNGLICKDNIRADIRLSFTLRVDQTVDSVLKVAKTVGAERASDIETVNELFNAKFSEALKTVAKDFDFLDLCANRYVFEQQVMNNIGDELNGYVLENVVVAYLDQTPIQHLDRNNILDAEAIAKISGLLESRVEFS